MQQLVALNLSDNPRLTDRGTLGFSPDDQSTVTESNTTDTAVFDDEKMHSASVARYGLFLLVHLRDLNLSRTSISSLTLKRGVNAPDLRKLSLQSCVAADDEGLYELAIRHPRLEMLHLGQTGVSDTGLISCLSCLPRLVHLDISSCQEVTSAG